jgi:hypothetical protein
MGAKGSDIAESPPPNGRDKLTLIGFLPYPPTSQDIEAFAAALRAEYNASPRQTRSPREPKSRQGQTGA